VRYPKCQINDREGIKFCEECRTRLKLKCPQCGAEILFGKKYCGECGHNLALPLGSIPKGLLFDEKLGKIQRYLPKDLTRKIIPQRDKIEREQKQVTVMFGDIKGFTPITEKGGEAWKK